MMSSLNTQITILLPLTCGLTISLLICFHMVEWHRSYQFFRQFGATIGYSHEIQYRVGIT